MTPSAKSEQCLRSALLPIVAAAVVAAAMMASRATAQAQADGPPVSFASKQIRLFIGFSPTGFGHDTYGRLLARHLGKYLPGGPSVVALNKPGAGSLNLANYTYNVAPRDGSEIAIVGRGVAADPMLNGNASNAMFDATRFTWLGSMNNEVSGFYIRQPGPAASLEDILGGRNLKVGATGAGGDQQVFAAALNSLLGTRLTTIGGYPGTNEILLAVERGELDGIVGYSWGVARSGNKDMLESSKLKILMQLALGKHKELPTIPLVTDFVTNSDDRKVLEVIFSRQSMGRPLVAPPGLDPRLARVLRAGLAAAMNDPELLAESARASKSISSAETMSNPGRGPLPVAARLDRARAGDHSSQIAGARSRPAPTAGGTIMVLLIS
jgi:tripartite-type tricarboxylate transporter receptor subunit TctC